MLYEVTDSDWIDTYRPMGEGKLEFALAATTYILTLAHFAAGASRFYRRFCGQCTSSAPQFLGDVGILIRHSVIASYAHIYQQQLKTETKQGRTISWNR
ncbi:hypothetical protein L596_020977 [Steinernema carpocapsae]|uniref:Uncharacterized protein n=1 Tax=Steinernema carpocapsae TaxID=34508 RepID=A0A4U5MV41_STECR|nr:hypothetical protein L596_020977 [Steinernema carpocapsae]